LEIKSLLGKGSSFAFSIYDNNNEERDLNLKIEIVENDELEFILNE
jgi:hypothetical protein